MTLSFSKIRNPASILKTGLQIPGDSCATCHGFHTHSLRMLRKRLTGSSILVDMQISTQTGSWHAASDETVTALQGFQQICKSIIRILYSLFRRGFLRTPYSIWIFSWVASRILLGFFRVLLPFSEAFGGPVRFFWDSSRNLAILWRFLPPPPLHLHSWWIFSSRFVDFLWILCGIWRFSLIPRECFQDSQ